MEDAPTQRCFLRDRLRGRSLLLHVSMLRREVWNILLAKSGTSLDRDEAHNRMICAARVRSRLIDFQ